MPDEERRTPLWKIFSYCKRLRELARLQKNVLKVIERYPDLFRHPEVPRVTEWDALIWPHLYLSIEQIEEMFFDNRELRYTTPQGDLIITPDPAHLMCPPAAEEARDETTPS